MGWKSKFGKIGLKLAGAFIPGLSTAVDAIEEAMPRLGQRGAPRIPRASERLHVV